MSPDVSIVIVNWNTLDMLRDCLRSVYEQTYEITLEVIVVDNASADGSSEMVRTEFSQVVLIENAVNRGFAAANNQGMTVARGRYVLLLNPDTVVLEDAVQRILLYADKHPDVAVVGCQVWENSKTIQQTCFRFPSVQGLLVQQLGIDRLFPRSLLLGREKMRGWDRNCERTVDVVSGMFMLVRREAIEEVGLMDEDYFVYAEETDWCDRFWKAGWQCVFSPIGRIIHRDGGSHSTEQVNVKMYTQKQKSILIFLKKRRGWLSWAIGKAIYTLSMCCRCAVFGTICLFGNNARICKKYAEAAAALKFHVLGIESR